MIVTVWITPPPNPLASDSDLQPGIQRLIFKEPYDDATAFRTELLNRLIGAGEQGQIEFGPVSDTGFTRIRPSTGGQR